MVDPTPFQTPPTLINAAGLASTFEYGLLWTGQSNSRPWGYPADAIELTGQAPALDLQDTGVDLTTVTIPANANRAAGLVEDIAVVADNAYANDQWNTGTWLRLGSATAPVAGYAKVLRNFGIAPGATPSTSTSTTLRVQWIVSPGTGSSTPMGYLVREGGNFSSYDQVRVLTSYAPLNDIRKPIGAETEWLVNTHAPYPTPNARLASGGRRLALPAPYAALPAAVDGFDDLGIFLPLTRREGADGYGISEIADSTYNGTGTPIQRPIGIITGDSYEFASTATLLTDSTLVGAYFLIDWESGGETKRSWSRVASNNTTSLATDGTWLGDGQPTTPPRSVVTFDHTTETVTWVGNPLVNGDRVFLDVSGGTIPTGLTAGLIYYVVNVSGDDFQLAESAENPVVVAFSDNGAPSIVATQVWRYTAWLPHWKDSPYTWIPGPEFAYPNEDQQPQAPFVHFRARGQLRYYHRDLLDPDIFETTQLYTPFDGVADARFGALLPCAYRMALALGKTMNVVALGVNSTGLLTLGILNSASYPGVLGWWDGEKYGYSLSLEDRAGVLSNRLKHLLEVVAPNALLIESNTKTLQIMSAFHLQGETDAAIDSGRELYGASITDYKRWLRDLVSAQGMSPYADAAKTPFVQPLITKHPWETTGQGVSFQPFGFDVNSEVNNAIRETHTVEEFATFTQVEDLPKLLYSNGKIDYGHYSGEGMAALGARLAAAALDLIDHALSYSSTALGSNATQLGIANAALQYLGQGARLISSLSENSAEARKAALLLPLATQELLAMRQWSWAMRLEEAAQVKNSRADWDYAYAKPARAVSVIAVLPPEDENLAIQGSRYASVLAPGDDHDLEFREPLPEQFEMGQSPSGHSLIYTNVPQIESTETAVGQTNGELNQDRLPRRARIRYVDKQVDPARYSVHFAAALAWMLTSKMATGFIKGPKGHEVAEKSMQLAMAYLGQEATHETVNRQRREQHRPSWIEAR